MPNPRVAHLQQLLNAMDVLPNEGEHFSNNNNPNSLWLFRDRLFRVLFYRATFIYASTCNAKLRKLIELVLLAIALISLSLLGYVHVAFVRSPVNCLEKEVQSWSREGVLRIEISMDEPTTKSFNISRYYNSTLASHFFKIKDYDQSLKKYLALIKERKRHRRINKYFWASNYHLVDEATPLFINGTLPFKDSVSDPDCFTPLKTTLSETEMFTNTVWRKEKYALEYSLEYGFLRLSAAARKNASVNVHTVILDPNKDQCFGNQVSRFLLRYLLGYNDLLMGSLRYLVDQYENKGYVRNVATGDQYRFIDKINTWTAYLSAAFCMLIFTLSVSMLLRYSHHQIFLFVVELLHIFDIFEMNTISFPAAPLLTVILALVGMEAIMSEFFNDSITAFYVIVIVWAADQYDSICCHTALSKRHFLRMFYLYHFGFYAYHYRFNGQYTALALVTSWLFTQHSMVYFFHRYELPSMIWVPIEADAEYESDAPHQADNHGQPAAAAEEDDSSDIQTPSTGENPEPLTLPTTSVVANSIDSVSVQKESKSAPKTNLQESAPAIP